LGRGNGLGDTLVKRSMEGRPVTSKAKGKAKRREKKGPSKKGSPKSFVPRKA